MFNGHTLYPNMYPPQVVAHPVNHFQNNLMTSTIPSPGNSEEFKEQKVKEEPRNEEEPQPEELVSTPLIKYVGQKLADKKLTNLASLKEGFFRYNLLSVASRGEWVAGKVITTFDKFGLTDSHMYDMAALKGQQGFKDYLKDAFASKKVDFGPERLTRQDVKLIHRVVDLIAKYFTFDGSAVADDDDDDFDFYETDAEKEQKPVQGRGLAELVKSLAAEAEKVSEVASEPELPPANPWSNMWNWMQSENFKTFRELKNNLAKGFMGSGYDKFRKDPFSAAQDLVSCWVVAGKPS
jgi:hypothetical protein